MRTMNRVTLIGNLGSDPDVRVGQSGMPWTTLSVATNRSRKEGDKWIEETDWHRVKCFGKDAEYAGKYLKKGSVVSVEGDVRYEAWTDKDQTKRWQTNIHVHRLALLANGRAAEEAQGSAPVGSSSADGSQAVAVA